MDSMMLELLSHGISYICKAHHVQACHLCERIECCDNENPLVREILTLKRKLAEADTKIIVQAVPK